jgi:hypothetical protein
MSPSIGDSPAGRAAGAAAPVKVLVTLNERKTVARISTRELTERQVVAG